MKEAYIKKPFRKGTLGIIAVVNGIVSDFRNQGYILTVRQLYYQLVARDMIPNTEKSYKNIVETINNGRMAGLIDWDMIEDRTRGFVERSSWSSGQSILEACASSFHMNMWDNQGARVFCIIEKEALVGVLQKVCNQYDIPLLAARGYPSSTVLREFCKHRLIPSDKKQERLVILHLGDHDPSGIDMSRDLEERVDILSRGASVEFRRLALNIEQIEELNLPPNPAKATDSRFVEYRKKFGDESWELDALSPSYLCELVEREVSGIIIPGLWEETEQKISEVKQKISKIAENFDGN